MLHYTASSITCPSTANRDNKKNHPPLFPFVNGSYAHVHTAIYFVVSFMFFTLPTLTIATNKSSATKISQTKQKYFNYTIYLK